MEASTVQPLPTFFEAQGYTMRGRHFKIYLSDPKRRPPEPLKTSVRQPIEAL